ncbi:MAG: flavodoxin family protein [Dehalococcoidaceae bacterium]|nr:flavodoxin family protein [Dehalococcoidaceae bacterium]
MKALVVYDSVYSNTEKIANAIGKGLEASSEVKVRKVNEVDPKYINEYDLVAVGSPTQAGRPLPSIKTFLEGIPADGLKGIKVASFDTGMPREGKGWFLKLVVKILGYAAPRIARSLESKGGTLTAPPEGFFVEDREGPLSDGEEDRAATWAKGLVKQ